MSYSAPGGSRTKMEELFYESAGPITVLLTDVLPTPKLLAKWQLTKAAGIADAKKYFADALGNAEMKTDTASDFISMAWYTSPDGVNWTRQIVGQTSSAVYLAREFVSPTAGNSLANALYIGFGFDMDGGIEGGNAKNIRALAHVFMPYGYTITRIL